MTKIAKQIVECVEKLPTPMQEQALVYVLSLNEKAANEKDANEPSGTKLARLMKEASSQNLLSHIKDPVAWQREIRKDRPLPGRE